MNPKSLESFERNLVNKFDEHVYFEMTKCVGFIGDKFIGKKTREAIFKLFAFKVNFLSLIKNDNFYAYKWWCGSWWNYGVFVVVVVE